jgi:DNA-binding CsgD family transcriptional regulator
VKSPRFQALIYMGQTIQLTDTDRAVLRFAAEHRFVIAAQVAALLGVSAAAAEARLRRLGTGGQVRRHKELHRGPTWHQITAAGLRAAGSDLPAPRGFDLATHRHDAGLGWLVLAARAGRFGPLEQVISERRMRSHDGRAEERSQRYGVYLGGVGEAGRDRVHYPDLVLVTRSGHRVAFELELSTKEVARRERILAGYAADRRIDAVVYLVERPSVGRAIERSVARMGISHLVRVQRVSMGPAVAAAPSRARSAHRAGARRPAAEERAR